MSEQEQGGLALVMIIGALILGFLTLVGCGAFLFLGARSVSSTAAPAGTAPTPVVEPAPEDRAREETDSGIERALDELGYTEEGAESETPGAQDE